MKEYENINVESKVKFMFDKLKADMQLKFKRKLSQSETVVILINMFKEKNKK